MHPPHGRSDCHPDARRARPTRSATVVAVGVGSVNGAGTVTQHMGNPNPAASSTMSRRAFGLVSVGTVGGATLAGRAATAANAAAPDPTAPKAQFRAFWIASVVNIDWPSATGLPVQQQKDELISWLDLASRLRMNAVILQVRPTADAFWPSPYEPWSQYLTGVQGEDPGYDPLAFAVTEAHRRSIELHAWFNPYRVSMQTDPARLVPTHPARVHPDWVFAYGPKLYYNPGIPEVRAFAEDAMLDAVANYDIDGVHFDDYYYPYPVAGQTLPDAGTFAEYGAGFGSIEDWRRDNINRLIREMQRRIHALKPWVRFGSSPFGIWRNNTSDPAGSATAGTESYGANFADTRTWVKEGWVDYVNPQIYWNIGFAVADYGVLAPWWSEQVAGTGVQCYAGEATYKVGVAGQPAAWQQPDELSKHLDLDETLPGISGNVYFSATEVRADPLHCMTVLAGRHYQHPAYPPPMPALDPSLPSAPVITAVDRDNAGVTVDWRTPRWPGRSESYAVYRFPAGTRPGAADRADATHLVAIVRSPGGGGSYIDTTAAAGTAYTYQISGLSRVSVEGPPSQPRLVPAR